MHTETATHVKNNFGAVMDMALREPVLIQRSGRNVAVMLAYEEYESLMGMIDAAWAKKAKKAKKQGFIGKKKSQAIIESMLNA